MKKLLALLLATVMFVFALASCNGSGDVAETGDGTGVVTGTETETDAAASDLDYIKSNGKMIIGITEYAPMNYKDDNGNWTGFDTEFAEAVCKELGIKAEFKVIEWDNKFPELKSKAIDCIWNGMTISDEVKLNTNVSDAYVKNAQVVVMKKDNISKYGDFDSMKDLSFAAESGSAGAKLVEEKSYDLVALSDQAAALLEVQSGSADACVIDITMANAMTGEGTSYSELGIACELNAEEYGIGFRIGSDMTAKVNEIMDKLIQNGTLDALAEKYDLTLVK